MYKVIAGFLLGVVVTLGAMQWLERPPPNTPESPVAAPAGSADVANPAQDAPASSAEEPATGQLPGRATPTVAGADFSEPSTETTSQSGDAASPASVSMRPERRPSAAIVGDRYPPEIADMIENRVDRELQARYENDRREDSWATYMEGQLQAYFAQKPELAQFSFSLIDCRTSVCSVHTLGYGHEALTQWNVATADLVGQPWFEFNNMSMNRRNPEPDILAIVLILTKRPADTGD